MSDPIDLAQEAIARAIEREAQVRRDESLEGWLFRGRAHALASDPDPQPASERPPGGARR